MKFLLVMNYFSFLITKMGNTKSTLPFIWKCGVDSAGVFWLSLALHSPQLFFETLCLLVEADISLLCFITAVFCKLGYWWCIAFVYLVCVFFSIPSLMEIIVFSDFICSVPPIDLDSALLKFIPYICMCFFSWQLPWHCHTPLGKTLTFNFDIA